MKIGKNYIWGFSGFVFFAMVILVMSFGAGANSEPSYCCERSISGAWCVSEEQGMCDSNYNAAPTSCETTSYCRLGTCYESEEGICMENTPSRTCIDSGGTWSDKEIHEVPQCQLGCCVIADQAAFVSLVRCKRLSTLFGVENDYRTDITNEVQCIAEANAQDVGACVYEKDFENVCEFTTRGECGAAEQVDIINGSEGVASSGKTFYKDYLCSAEELNTACAKQTSTACYQSDVYWMDSCGNRENVYSSDKTRSWNRGRVLDGVEICGPNDGSNRDCGNCDYMLGSRCAEFEGFTGGPQDGDYYCQRTECMDRNGDARINGEAWCVMDEGNGNGGDRVGSRYYREICVDGEVRVEPCSDFRNEVCIEDSIETSDGDFGTAACRVNRWQNCWMQTEEDDCLNIDQRDCMWLPSVKGMVLGGGQDSGVAGGSSGGTYSNPSNDDAFSNPTGNVVAPITGNAFFGDDDEDEELDSAPDTNRPDGICVPNYSPGLKFWEESARQNCGIANAKCVVTYEEGLIGGSKCVEGCECLSEGWAQSANRICTALGDCGGYVNYEGVYTSDGYNWVVDGEKKEL